MSLARLAICCLLVVAPAAVPTDAGALSKVRYRLTVELRAKDVYTSIEQPVGVPDGGSEQRATYRAATRSPFVIRRSSRGSKARFSFRAVVVGKLTWQGSGAHTGKVLPPQCNWAWTEEVWPDKRRVSGTIRLEPATRGRIGIFIAPDATGQVGVSRWHPDIDCVNKVRPLYANMLGLLNITEQLTEVVDLRERFGRNFSVEYEPGAIADHPNLVSPTTKAEYDYRWTLDFKRVG